MRLSYTGAGVVFLVSTDGGTKWQKLEPGREVMLDTPGTSLLVKILLLLDPATVLYDYRIDINPYHDMSFTGKFLEPEIGLIYFGGRWYEPGIGRWVTVDPAEEGLNWYRFCHDNPVSIIDPDGRTPFILPLLLNLSIAGAMTPPDSSIDQLLLNMGAYALATGVGYIIKGPMFIKGLASSFTLSVTTQMINKGYVAWALVGFDTAVGGAIGALGDAFKLFMNRHVPRPKPLETEQFLANKLGPSYQPQVTFQDGNRIDVNYIVRNSTKPDFYYNLQSIEAKNYFLSSSAGRDRFIRDVCNQAIKRALHLPINSKQILYVDIRGQNVSYTMLRILTRQIVDRSYGIIHKVIYITCPEQFFIPFSSQRQR